MNRWFETHCHLQRCQVRCHMWISRAITEYVMNLVSPFNEMLIA